MCRTTRYFVVQQVVELFYSASVGGVVQHVVQHVRAVGILAVKYSIMQLSYFDNDRGRSSQ